MKNKKSWWFLTIILIILIFACSFWINQESKIPKTLKIGDKMLNIKVAKTNLEREKGLSGQEMLAENEGLLFVFEKEGNYGIWMKNMDFSIDIAWLNEDKKIIYIEKEVNPKTYPKIFNSPQPSIYVLETAAGFFENSKIEIGDFAEF